MSRLLSPASMLLTVVCCAPGLAHSADGKLTAAVDAYVKPLRDLDVFSGVVLVARGPQVLVSRAYGLANADLLASNQVDQVFRIASLAKPFTDMALGRLSDQGKLGLDDPLAKTLPGFPAGERITLRMLVQHRAGVPNLNSIPWDEESAVHGNLDSLVAVLAARPLDFEPGAQRRYSNGGYALLASVIERVCGASYAAVLQREVCAPLGLGDTRHEGDFEVVHRRATGYEPAPSARHQLVPAAFQQMSTKTGGGSLVSTAADLHTMLMALGSSPLLRPATWSELLAPSDSLWFFQGRCPGFNAVAARWQRDGLCVVVLSNNYASGMVADVAHGLALLARGGAPTPFGWRADLAADSTRCAAYTGRWRVSAGALPFGDLPLALHWQGGELVATVGGAPVDVLVPQPDGGYLLRALWSTVQFDLPAAGDARSRTCQLRYLWRQGGVSLEREPRAAGG